jgi:hypothetical protein
MEHSVVTMRNLAMEFSWAVPSITGPQADGGGRNIRSNCHASAAGHNGKRAFQKLERMTVFRALQLTLNQRVALVVSAANGSVISTLRAGCHFYPAPT